MMQSRESGTTSFAGGFVLVVCLAETRVTDERRFHFETSRNRLGESRPWQTCGGGSADRFVAICSQSNEFRVHFFVQKIRVCSCVEF